MKFDSIRIPHNIKTVPIDSDEFGEFQFQLFDIWDSLVAEYFNSAFARRAHGNHKTAQAGCKGPHCSSASRQMSRKYSGSTPSEWSELYEPIIEYLAEIIANEREIVLSELCENLTRVHITSDEAFQNPT